jgi:hypothetical protein
MRLMAAATICCFLTVSVLADAFGLLCIPICKKVEIVEVEELESSGCMSCCPSENSFEESPCSQMVIEETACKDLCSSEDTSCETSCCKCFAFNLTSILTENRIPTPETVLAQAPVDNLPLDNARQHLSLSQSCPQGIHSFISTAVLRL